MENNTNRDTCLLNPEGEMVRLQTFKELVMESKDNRIAEEVVRELLPEVKATYKRGSWFDQINKCVQPVWLLLGSALTIIIKWYLGE